MEKQVKDSEDQQPEEFEALSEDEETQKVNELLNEQAVEQTETDETDPVGTEVVETEETSKEAPVLVDDDLVSKYPALRAHYGKPLAELGQHYQSIVVEFNKNRQEMAALKKQLTAATIPKIEDEPDPVDNPEEHKKWTKEREEAIRLDERSKIQQPQQINYAGEIAKNLPSDIDVNKVIQSWSNVNAYRLYDKFGELLPEMQLLYQNNPQVLIREVIEYYELSSKADKTDEEIRKAGHIKARSDFKKARQNKKDMPKADVHVIERETQTNETDRMLANIMEMEKEE